MVSWAAGCCSGREEEEGLQVAVQDLRAPLICEQGPGWALTWGLLMAAHQEWAQAGLPLPTPAAGTGGP